jgi:hypothetical protein
MLGWYSAAWACPPALGIKGKEASYFEFLIATSYSKKYFLTFTFSSCKNRNILLFPNEAIAYLICEIIFCKNESK